MADCFFDGPAADIMVQSKINEAKNQCEYAITKVRSIRLKLFELLEEEN
ncbi:MAG: hypothetical protein J5643_07885 [Lachnospiraceae bacterium]|nr:hypothetical protein [Lachnospiraceae bacterium]